MSSRSPTSTPTGFARDALRAAAALHHRATDVRQDAALEWELVQATRELLGGRIVALLAPDRDGLRVHPVSTDPFLPITADEPVAALVELEHGSSLGAGHPVALGPDDVATVSALLELLAPAREVILLPLGSEARGVLALVDPPEGLDVEGAAAFAVAGGAALAGRAVAREQQARSAEQRALARASRVLHASLDLQEVLQAISEEACGILDADHSAAYLGGPREGLVIEACVNLPASAIGYRMGAGEGLSGRVLQTGRPMLTNHYEEMRQPGRSPFAGTCSSVAVPIRWDGEIRGVLAIGHTRRRIVTDADLALLEAFGELAAAACRNASNATGLAMAARTDGLTGLLNHAAFQEGLAREVARSAARPQRRLACVLLDLDEFKRVNEEGGHLAGDAFLRDVGAALRLVFGGSHLIARYGGDEFAVLLLGADEGEASALAAEGVARIRQVSARHGLPWSSGATAGVATLLRDDSPTSLLDAADRALLVGKQELGRGCVVRASSLDTRPEATEELLPAADPSALSGLGLSEHDRLQKRTRQLAMASALGSRLAALTDPQEICEAAVEELHRAFGYYLCAAVALDEAAGEVHATAVRGGAFERLGHSAWHQGRDIGLIGRCLRSGHVVLAPDVRLEEEYVLTEETGSTRAECVAPVWVGDRLWGVLNCEEAHAGAFDPDDARLLQTVADQVGSALRAAELYAQLDEAYLGTAEALATALEAKDAYTAEHARSIVERAEAVGRRLGLDGPALRDLRFGAAFHDIGKIAVPEAILDKQGPLTPEERVVVERHTVVGEQILRPVAFLRDVLPIVRHEHERFDGRGYPDGLAGSAIPIGARIVLVCDAFHAMTSDRPYRAALDVPTAVRELRDGAGTQFDPEVVRAFLAVAGLADVDEPAFARAS